MCVLLLWTYRTMPKKAYTNGYKSVCVRTELSRRCCVEIMQHCATIEICV